MTTRNKTEGIWFRIWCVCNNCMFLKDFFNTQQKVSHPYKDQRHNTNYFNFILATSSLVRKH